MSTKKKINVEFFNKFDALITDVTIKFSASKDSVKPNSYHLGDMEKDAQSGPHIRHYENGLGSENSDYWYVEFTSDKKKYWVKQTWSCVVDDDIPTNSTLHFWVSQDKCAYTGFPNSKGGYPGEGGYTGVPKEVPKDDWTCRQALES